jgi:GYF domain 2
MSTTHETPILTRVLYTFGALTIIGAVIIGGVMIYFDSLSAGIAVIAGGLFAGIVYIGIGQTVDYLARTAHATDQLSAVLQGSIAQRLESIEGRLSPPLLVRVDTTPPSPAARSSYYFSLDGTKQGPLPASEMRRLWGGGVLRDDTPVLRDGETQWRTYGELLSLRKKSGEETHDA